MLLFLHVRNCRRRRGARRLFTYFAQRKQNKPRLAITLCRHRLRGFSGGARRHRSFFSLNESEHQLGGKYHECTMTLEASEEFLCPGAAPTVLLWSYRHAADDTGVTLVFNETTRVKSVCTAFVRSLRYRHFQQPLSPSPLSPEGTLLNALLD